MLNTLGKSTILTSVITLSMSLIAAPVSYAQSTPSTSPALIKQNIGSHDRTGNLSKAVEDILTLDNLEVILELTDLNEELDSKTHTLFAPRDSSFWQTSSDDYKRLMEGGTYAKDVLLSHVVAGNIDSATLISEINTSGNGTTSRETLNGKTLTFALEGPFVTVTDSTGAVGHITHADINTNNGHIHIINSVLDIDNYELNEDYS